MKRVF
jgi:hypothetical protein